MNEAERQTRSRAPRISSRSVAYCAVRSKYGTSTSSPEAEPQQKQWLEVRQPIASAHLGVGAIGRGSVDLGHGHLLYPVPECRGHVVHVKLDLVGVTQPGLRPIEPSVAHDR